MLTSPILLSCCNLVRCFSFNDLIAPTLIPVDAINKIIQRSLRSPIVSYDTITGTIVNNVAKNISFATVYAALYDKNNTLITMESGYVFVSLLKARDKSSFAIDIIGVKDIDHYTLFPAGIPS